MGRVRSLGQGRIRGNVALAWGVSWATLFLLCGCTGAGSAVGGSTAAGAPLPGQTSGGASSGGASSGGASPSGENVGPPLRSSAGRRLSRVELQRSIQRLVGSDAPVDTSTLPDDT